MPNLCHENVERLRAFQKSGKLAEVKERLRLLKKLRAVLKESYQEIIQALYADLRKSEAEAICCELALLKNALNTTIAELRDWAEPRPASPGLFNFPATARIQPQPYGTVLVGATWNYPILLSLEPLIGALAAGNATVLKLSESCEHTSRLLMEIVAKLEAPDAVWATLEPWERILNEQFDYIFFTGGERLGRAVMLKAAENLTPVTLELGGKSPCIVTEKANLRHAARRIVWGKFTNVGQTCVAPDYLYVQNTVKEPLVVELRRAIAKMYGENPQESPDYARIINDFHFNRLTSLLGGGQLLCGGESDAADRYIAPTMLDAVTWDSPIMQQEIFGPILPVLEFETLNEALTQLATLPKPLALYFFSRDRKELEEVEKRTTSGGMAVNDTLMHFASPELPFGGVGSSGMGSYHGKRTFDTFTHYRSELIKTTLPEVPLRFPPGRGWKLFLMRLFGK